jgi:hypothetical protein
MRTKIKQTEVVTTEEEEVVEKEEDEEVIQTDAGVLVVEGEGVGTIALKEEGGAVEGKAFD